MSQDISQQKVVRQGLEKSIQGSLAMLSPEIHKRVKISAASIPISVDVLVNQVLNMWLNEHK